MGFFVYVIRDPRPGFGGECVYVGKGCRDRARRHLSGSHNSRLNHFIAKRRREGLEPIVEIVRRFAGEDVAFLCEMELIAKYGRRDKGSGSLFNLTDGGEGSSGCPCPPATIERLRRMHADPVFAKARTERFAKINAAPRFKEERANWMRQINADPATQHIKIEMTRAAQNSPRVAEARLERMARLNADPDFRLKQAEAVRRTNADPEFARARDERMRRQNADPEFRRKQAASMEPLRIAQAEHL